MQPNDVFYAIVCESPDDYKPKKVVHPYRRTFDKFVQIANREMKSVLAGGNPTLYSSWIEADTDLKWVKTVMVGPEWEGWQFWIEIFRLTESDWNHQTQDDETCRSRDARRLASGMLHYDTIAQQVKKLAGKVLTVIDAAYVNESQNKAVKDLTKNSFRSQLSDIYQKAYEDADCDSCEGTCQKDILDD